MMAGFTMLLHMILFGAAVFSAFLLAKLVRFLPFQWSEIKRERLPWALLGIGFFLGLFVGFIAVRMSQAPVLKNMFFDLREVAVLLGCGFGIKVGFTNKGEGV